MHPSALRRILPADVIVTESQAYGHVLDGHRLDAEEFLFLGGSMLAALPSAASAPGWPSVACCCGEASRIRRSHLDAWRETAASSYGFASIRRVCRPEVTGSIPVRSMKDLQIE
jgi:hypothetical protein